MALQDDTETVEATSVGRETRWIAWLFMIGSTCFVLPSIPALAEVVPAEALALTYFIGSIFFTSAALLLAATTWRDTARADRAPLRSVDWWAAVIQLVGTLWFNLNTFHALQQGMTAHEENLRVWTPDFLGSICFLVSSYLSYVSVCGKPACFCRGSRDWNIAVLNLVGSVFFMLSAFAAFTLPSTDNLLDASVANTGTLLGGVCFFWGARLLLPADATPVISRTG